MTKNNLENYLNKKGFSNDPGAQKYFAIREEARKMILVCNEKFAGMDDFLEKSQTYLKNTDYKYSDSRNLAFRVLSQGFVISGVAPRQYQNKGIFNAIVEDIWL